MSDEHKLTAAQERIAVFWRAANVNPEAPEDAGDHLVHGAITEGVNLRARDEVAVEKEHLRGIDDTLGGCRVIDKGGVRDQAWRIQQIAHLRAWVSDLQSGMYVNCVYCGHRCEPGETTSVSMADALKMHIEECPKHPMSALKSEVARLRTRDEAAVEMAKYLNTIGLVNPYVAKMVRHFEEAMSDREVEEGPAKAATVIASLRAEVEQREIQSGVLSWLAVLASRHAEINDLRTQLVAVTDERDIARAELSDQDEWFQAIMAEECSPDEKHCTCVPMLRAKLTQAQGVVDALMAHRKAKQDMACAGEEVEPGIIRDFAGSIRVCKRVMEAWSAVEKQLDALPPKEAANG